MDLYACQQIHHEPALITVPAPDPGLVGYQALERAVEKIDRSPGWFDGPITMVAKGSNAGELRVFSTRFRWLVALNDPAIARCTTGALSVAAVLQNEKGELLWQLRSPHVREPGLWSLSASGTVDSGRGLRSAIASEGATELGLDKELLSERLRVFGLLAHPGIGVTILYRGLIDRADMSGFKPNNEIRDLMWSPLDLAPSGLDPTARTAMPLLRYTLNQTRQPIESID